MNHSDITLTGKATLFVSIILLFIFGFVVPALSFGHPIETDSYSHYYILQVLRNTHDIGSAYTELSNSHMPQLSENPIGLYVISLAVSGITGLDIDKITFILPLILIVASSLMFYSFLRLFFGIEGSMFGLLLFLTIPYLSNTLLNFRTLNLANIFFIFTLLLLYKELNLKKRILLSFLASFMIVFSHRGTSLILAGILLVYLIFQIILRDNMNIHKTYILISMHLLNIFLLSLILPNIMGVLVHKANRIIQSSVIYFFPSLTFFQDFNLTIIVVVFTAVCILLLQTFMNLKSMDTGIKKLKSLVNGKGFYARIFFLLVGATFIGMFLIRDFSSSKFGSIGIIIRLGLIQVMLLLAYFVLAKPRFYLDARLALLLSFLFVTVPTGLSYLSGTGPSRRLFYLSFMVPIYAVMGYDMLIWYFRKLDMKNVMRLSGYVTISIIVIATTMLGNSYFTKAIDGRDSEINGLQYLSEYPGSIIDGNGYRQRIEYYAGGVDFNSNGLVETEQEFNIVSPRTQKTQNIPSQALSGSIQKTNNVIYSTTDNFYILQD